MRKQLERILEVAVQKGWDKLAMEIAKQLGVTLSEKQIDTMVDVKRRLGDRWDGLLSAVRTAKLGASQAKIDWLVEQTQIANRASFGEQSSPLRFAVSHAIELGASSAVANVLLETILSTGVCHDDLENIRKLAGREITPVEWGRFLTILANKGWWTHKVVELIGKVPIESQDRIRIIRKLLEKNNQSSTLGQVVRALITEIGDDESAYHMLIRWGRFDLACNVATSHKCPFGSSVVAEIFDSLIQDDKVSMAMSIIQRHPTLGSVYVQKFVDAAIEAQEANWGAEVVRWTKDIAGAEKLISLHVSRGHDVKVIEEFLKIARRELTDDETEIFIAAHTTQEGVANEWGLLTLIKALPILKRNPTDDEWEIVRQLFKY